MTFQPVQDQINESMFIWGTTSTKPIEVKILGKFTLITNVKNNAPCHITLNDTISDPKLRTNLISVKQLCERGANVKFVKNKAYVNNHNNALVLQATLRNGVYTVDLHKPTVEARYNQINYHVTAKMWHERLGHLSLNEMIKLRDKDLMKGLTFTNQDAKSFANCEAYARGKQSWKKFGKFDLNPNIFFLPLIKCFEKKLIIKFRSMNEIMIFELVSFNSDL